MQWQKILKFLHIANWVVNSCRNLIIFLSKKLPKWCNIDDKSSWHLRVSLSSLSPSSCALCCLLQENTKTNVHRLNLMGRKICVYRFLNVQHVHISSMYTCSFFLSCNDISTLENVKSGVCCEHGEGKMWIWSF